MDWELVAKVIAAVGAMLVAWRGIAEHSIRRRDLHELKQSIDIFQAIPESWETKAAVRSKVEADIHKLFHPDGRVALAEERKKLYDATLGAVMLACTVVLFLSGSAWSLVTGMLGAGALMAGAEGSRKAVSKAKGEDT